MKIPIETYTLDNGLRVVLSEDHTAPIVAVNIWYHVGSGNERPGRTGFAHLFEHMLFQGSENVGSNEHFELIQRAGGTVNGSTWLERTNYYETLPSNGLALALWLEADRMGRLLPAMTQQKLDTQRDVVKNERMWSVDNQPYGTWWEKMPALAFPEEHPFHHSLIGSMEDLDAACLDDIETFFRTYYTPDNAVLSVSGDFRDDETRDVIERYFGEIPRGQDRPPLHDTSVPETFGKRLRQVVPDDVPLARLFLAFRSPVFGTREYYAASVCGAVMGMRKGSRLQASLVREKEVATDVSAFTFDLSKGSDLLILDVTARPGIDAQTLEREVEAEVDRVVTGGITESEIRRAVAIITTDIAASLQSAGDRADKLSMFTTYFDDPRMLNSEIERYEAVTIDEVNRFAGARLVRENRASLVYVPRATEGGEG